MSTSYNSKKIGNIYINSNLTTDGIIKIDANYNYSYDEINNFSHIYKFYNYYQKFKEVKINHNIISNIVNDKFNIRGVNSTKINLLIYLVNNNKDNNSIELFDYNTVQVIYNDNIDTLKPDTNKENISDNLEKIDENKNNISSNLGKIDTNKENILSLKDSNIKSFYNLDKIFIHDVKNGEHLVNKDNYYHIFEKEIIHKFIKDLYLEIILEILTEISNYVLIGFFQILCKFIDENDDLFYTISLSTAMGSINRLSTISSVFIVPINKSMNKIKIHFVITPKIGQENRSARFTIHEINSNKIYVKYFQKTDEISIKNIEDSLNTVNNISADLEKIEKNKKNISDNLDIINTNKSDISSNLEIINTNKSNISSNLEIINTNKNNISTNLIGINTNEDSIAYNSEEINYIKNNISKPYLKNIHNILFYDKKTQIDFRNLFYENYFDVNANKNDFIEISLRMLLEYSSISNKNYVKTIYELFDENDNSLYVKSVSNNDYQYYSNKIFTYENIFYNFTKDFKKIKFVIKFEMILP